ncbi:MAG TPA: CRTAC1 family protein [Bryobacteraceae bacterium]|nr:CRTAC1 family protein [Bryobacteraceae bacterium]
MLNTHVQAFQGMSSPARKGRPAEVKTSLPPIQVDFRDIAEAAGLSAVNVSGAVTGKKYLIEATGNGVVIFDYDNDGLMDVFLVNGSTLDRKSPGASATSHLYRNLGNLHFEDVTQKAGLARPGWGQGACAADYDNDGRRDLFVTYYGHSILYHNEGGSFRDVTAAAGLASEKTRWDTGCSFLDYDVDGRLDLVVSGYVDFDPAKTPLPGAGENCTWKGMPVMCGPRGLPNGRNFLFHNNGKGFSDVSSASGVGKRTPCYGFTAIASDFDNDGYSDIYIACDSTASLLYHNLRNGSFEEIGLISGAALNDDGQEQAGMGAAAADYDEDGWFDIAKTNFSDDTPNLYRNNGDGTFSDRVYAAGLGARSQYLGWGIHFLDVDHDGRRELLLINGHVYPEVDRSKLAVRYSQPRLLYWNVGEGKFKDISATSGAGITAEWSSRGSAQGDLDNDGSLEIVINNMGARPSLLRNYGPRKNWLLVECAGVKCNRDAVGARVFVYAGGRRLSGEVQTGSSYLSQNDSRLHFGLDQAASYDRIEVQWPGGSREPFAGGPANRIVRVKQGGGS